MPVPGRAATRPGGPLVPAVLPPGRGPHAVAGRCSARGGQLGETLRASPQVGERSEPAPGLRPQPRAASLVPARPHGCLRVNPRPWVGGGCGGCLEDPQCGKGESAMLQAGQLAPSVAVTSARTRRGVPPGPSENARDRISQKALLLGPPGTTGGDVRSPGLPVGGPANPLGFSFPAYRLSVRCIGPYPRRLRR